MTVTRRLLLVAAASAAATIALVLASADALDTLARTDPAWWGRAELSAALVAALAGIGSLGAAWHLLSALVAIAATRQPRSRLTRTALEHWGAPLVRRIAVGALLAGMAAAPAAAAESPGPESPDLGWQPTSGQSESAGIPASPDSPAPEEPSGSSTGADSAASAAAPDESAPSSPSGEPGTAPAVPEASSATGAAGGGNQTGGGPDDQAAGAPSPQDGAADPARRAEGDASPGTAGRQDTLVVEPGQSLWSISAARLGPQASAADIARAWPRLYQANREAIGPEPGLIHPGLRLAVPDSIPASDQGS